MTVWFLVIWWSVIPNPYPSQKACMDAMSIMGGALVTTDGTIISKTFTPAPYNNLNISTDMAAYPRSWCIPAPGVSK